MCRLLVTKNFKELKNKDIKKFINYLEDLENSCGGHGNTFHFIYENGKQEISRKPDFTKFTPQQAGTLIKDKKASCKYFIFHTRITSTGRTLAVNTHPAKKKSLYLYQNGTVHYDNFIKKITNTEWDTQTTLNLLTSAGKKEFVDNLRLLKSVSSVWVLTDKKGNVGIVNGNSMGDLCSFKDFGLEMLASEPSEKAKDIVHLGQHTMWLNGSFLKKNEKERYTYGYSCNSRYSWGGWSNDVYYQPPTKCYKGYVDVRQYIVSCPECAGMGTKTTMLCAKHLKKCHYRVQNNVFQRVEISKKYIYLYIDKPDFLLKKFDTNYWFYDKVNQTIEYKGGK